MARPKVVVDGDFVGGGSLGVVNRGLCDALVRRGAVDLAIRAEATPAPLSGGEGRRLEPLRYRALDSPDVTIRHRWPPGLADVRHGAYVQIQPWEYGALPKLWAETWPDAVDEVWCYSSYVARQYVEAGFAPQRVHVVPLGFDPAVFSPRPPELAQRRSEPRCVFLFVGATIPRKGIDLVVNVYLSTFKAADDVLLVIKDLDPGGVYSAGRMREELLRLVAREDLAPVRYIDSMLDQEAMTELYRNATCLVHPYRGEGFALPVLEAMACGIPAIVTRGGATDDFVRGDCSYAIAAKRVAASSNGSVERIGDKWYFGPVELVADGWFLEPDPYEIMAAMQQVYEHPEDAARRGRAASEHAVASWTWDHAAARVQERIVALASTKPVRKLLDHPLEINAFEQKVCSQNGEDGIIAEIFRRLGSAQPFFVEFGVEEGLECNMRYAALTFGWSGVMLDGDAEKSTRLALHYAEVPRVKTAQAFVTRENARGVFERLGIPSEFELLSIDIDGNDYWVWEALGEAYRPKVVVIEINPAYPPPRRWVMEYNPNHAWAYDSYYGSSLTSMTALAERLGYALIGVESAGVNAFYVRADVVERAGFAVLTPEAAFKTPRYRHRERSGPFVEV